MKFLSCDYRWCGHCKKLVPEYEKLGEVFKDNSNVVIAKVDATANDSPAEVRGFPTIIFYPAGDKSNPVTFSGERNSEKLEEFVRKNGKTEGVDVVSEETETEETEGEETESEETGDAAKDEL